MLHSLNPDNSTVESLSPPKLYLALLFFLGSLVGLATLLVGGGDTTEDPEKRKLTQLLSQLEDKEPHIDFRSTFKSYAKKNPVHTLVVFFKRIPRRCWNFYADTFLVPVYRPEWNKYKFWSYKATENADTKNSRTSLYAALKQRLKLAGLIKRLPQPMTHDHSGCQRVKFNINGKIFETQLRTLDRYPNSLLGDSAKRQRFYDKESNTFFFDRNPASFEAILYFFQSGGHLRRPENIHLDMFCDDAYFYGLPHYIITEFKAGEGLVENFEGDEMPKNLLRKKLWLLFEYPESSIQGHLIGIYSVFVVIVSIVMFCVETLKEFTPREGPQPIMRVQSNGKVTQREFKPVSMRDPFFFVETMCSAWFTFEYGIRLICAPALWKFVTGLHNIIDLGTVLPYYLTVTSVFSSTTGKAGRAGLSVIRVIRLIRVFRIFKLSRHSKGLKILGLTLRNSMSELFLLFFFVLLGVIIFSSCLYFAEQGQNSDFTSIPDGFWYVVVTMTTVGFGDVYPRTVMGKIIGSICAIAGVLTIALPVPVIVSNFNFFYHQAMDEQDFNLAKIHYVPHCPYRSPDEGSGGRKSLVEEMDRATKAIMEKPSRKSTRVPGWQGLPQMDYTRSSQKSRTK